MRRSFNITFLLLAPCLFASGKASAKDAAKPAQIRTEQSFDRSRQLLVSGGSFKQRVELLRVLESLRDTTLKSLGQPLLSYPVARPILCVFRPSLAADTPPKLAIIEDPGGIKLQAEFPPFDGPPSAEMERFLLGAVLMELSVRPGPGVGAHPPGHTPTTPRWLVDAILHKHRNPDPLLAPIDLRALLDAGEVPSVRLVLTRPEEDPILSSQTEVDLARCLLGLLANRDDSREGFRRLLQADSLSQPIDILLKCFPSLPRTESGLLREWTLQVAAAGTQSERISLNGVQTEAQIQNLLQIDLTSPVSGEHHVFPLEQFEDFMRLPGSRDLLTARALEWGALRSRAHFLFAPVLTMYAEACASLAAGKTAGIAQRLKQGTLERESIAAKLSRIHDHLNWYEAVAAPRSVSPQLNEMYRILDARPQVSDAVRRALDQAEREVRQNEEQQDLQRALEELRGRPKSGR